MSEQNSGPDKTWPRGLRVANVRPITPEELEREGWEDHQGATSVIEFNDGSTIYASRDPEGNGPGCFFGVQEDGTPVGI